MSKRARSESGEESEAPATKKATTALATTTVATTTTHPVPSSRYHYAMICSSNMNRSCAGHLSLLQQGIHVTSYGAGAQVKIPGKHGARTFNFGTTYDDMYKALETEDAAFYKANEMLSLLDRNRNMKSAPERWQESDVVGKVNVAVCFDDRIFELVDEDCANRDAVDYMNLHVINIDTVDNPEAAAASAELALELCRRLDEMEELDESEVPEVIAAFEKEKVVQLKHSMHCL